MLIGAAVVGSGCGGGSGKTTKSAGPPTGTGTGAASAAAPAGAVVASAGAVEATMHATTHAPRANKPWPLRFVVTDAGRAAQASVRYQFLLAGQVVARRSHYRFAGRFSDIVVWPASAVGYPLTFRAIVNAAGRTLNLDYPVTVTK